MAAGRPEPARLRAAASLAESSTGQRRLRQGGPSPTRRRRREPLSYSCGAERRQVRLVNSGRGAIVASWSFDKAFPPLESEEAKTKSTITDGGSACPSIVGKPCWDPRRAPRRLRLGSFVRPSPPPNRSASAICRH